MKKVLNALKVIIFFIISAILVLFFDNQNKKEVTFDSCVDGDTGWFIVSGKKVKIRFLGIDTPEVDTEIGKEVKKYTCDYLSKSSNVIIEYEDGVTEDKYGRTLAWIWVDNKLFQQVLVEKGYAKVAYVYGDYSYIDSLCFVQKKAIDSGVGIWKNNKNDEGYCSKIDYSNSSKVKDKVR